ncbi:MAG: FAD-binding molybdopterin dehydrogenase, partial [Candidatus Cybelea sp.]
MNLNTIKEVKRPESVDEIRHWRDGYAWLAGGTWLFSEPQIHTDTLIDLETLGWQAIASGRDGIELAATCKIAELYAFEPLPEWSARALIGECCRAFLSSFKIWNEA